MKRMREKLGVDSQIGCNLRYSEETGLDNNEKSKEIVEQNNRVSIISHHNDKLVNQFESLEQKINE